MVHFDFMMHFELGLEKPDPKRALTSALTIGLSYIAGRLIPLAPYMLIPKAGTALVFSVVSTLVALLIFGYVKGRLTGARLSAALRPQRDSDCADRRACGRRGLWPGQSNFVAR